MSKQTWSIIRDYIQNRDGLVHHQINSFNAMLHNDIRAIVSNDNVIKVNHDTYSYVLHFSNVQVGYPAVIEDNRILKRIFPVDCRLRDLSYSAAVFVDLREEIHDHESMDVKTKIYHRVIIAQLPIMLRSSHCHLSTMSSSELIQKGECHFDKGGYFIIKGKERVLISQMRGVYNKVTVYKEKKASKSLFTSEIRSMCYATSHSVLTTCSLNKDDRTLTFQFPNIKESIPVGVVIKAMGASIRDWIPDGTIPPHLLQEFNRRLVYIERDSALASTPHDALYYIGRAAFHSIKESEFIPYAKQVVFFEIFPHLSITASIKCKLWLLGSLVRKVLYSRLGIRSIDDRDDFVNKRIEPAGVLCGDLFRTLYKRYCNSIASYLDKKKHRHPDTVSFMNRTSLITKGLLHCFQTGNWGVRKSSYIRQGVSQVLSRLTFGGTLSHLRRIAIPSAKEGRNSKLRQIHGSQIMFVCPTETPEGQSVGVVLNLSLLTTISTNIPTYEVKDYIQNIKGVIPIASTGKNFYYPILVNGDIYGFHRCPKEFISTFRQRKRLKLIPFGVSASICSKDNEIIINSCAGRLLRPIYPFSRIHELASCTDWNTLEQNGNILWIDNSEAESSVIAFTKDELVCGKRFDYLEIHPSLMLGVMGNMIPFPHMSQSPRNAYQSSMGKQAMSFFARSMHRRADTCVHVLNYPQKPIVATEASKIMGFSDMPSGINCIVAIVCYGGMNQEDSVIINQSAIERGLFRATTYRTHTAEEKKEGTYQHFKIALPTDESRRGGWDYTKLDHDGVILSRTASGKAMTVTKGTVIIGKQFIQSDKSGHDTITDCSVVIKKGEDGTIDRIESSITPDGYRLVKVIIRKERIPEIGDKFCARSAQKSTVGMVYTQENMPFTSTGMVPDLIINPHAMPSRMTINQLLECALGKIGAIDGEFKNATAFEQIDIANATGKRLRELGHDECTEQLYSGFTGEPLDAKIFIGPTYYQRLKHLVSDKFHARAGGAVTTLTRQPPEGRSRNGGLRFG